MPENPTATVFLRELRQRATEEQRRKYGRYFKMGEGEYAEGDQFIGVPMGQVFELAKEFIDMSLDEIEKMLDSPFHEARAGSISIMDKSCRRKSISDERRQDYFDLYLRRHDRINNWDLVDLGAQWVIGCYLEGKARDVLYGLARSASLWERRTAIVATAYFLRQGEVDDTFRIAEILIEDPEELVEKAVGGWLRQAGKSDRARLLSFLGQYAARMPRTMLTYSVEHLDKEQKAYYRSL